LEAPSLRLYLLGDLTIESEGRVLLDANAVRGQARLVFTFLAFNRGTAVARSDLATVVWDEEAPDAWETALSAILSKLRSTMANSGMKNLAILSRDPAVTRLVLPAGAWVDIEAAASSLDAAEGALRRGEIKTARPEAMVAVTILRRYLLPGDNSEWAVARRGEMKRQLIRALDCLSEISLTIGESGAAIEAAEEAIRLDPLRERSHQLLIRAQTAAGNRAAGIRSYQQLKERLAEELGVDPAAETQDLYLRILA
jgi:SARP family transcriptional regulator, regulator of embCAB operon